MKVIDGNEGDDDDNEEYKVNDSVHGKNHRIQTHPENDDDNYDVGDDDDDDDDDVAGPTDPDRGLNKPIARRPTSRSKQPCALL